MNKVIDLKTKLMPVVCGTSAMVLASTIVSHAEDATADSALVTGATNAVAQVQANINAVVPIALGIMGVVLAVKIGIRVFKSVTKSSAG